MNADSRRFAALSWRFHAPLTGDNVPTTFYPVRRADSLDRDDDAVLPRARQRTGT